MIKIGGRLINRSFLPITLTFAAPVFGKKIWHGTRKAKERKQEKNRGRKECKVKNKE